MVSESILRNGVAFGGRQIVKEYQEGNRRNNHRRDSANPTQLSDSI
jgi:hypothetical protein